jgi:hypothetical protein
MIAPASPQKAVLCSILPVTRWPGLAGHDLGVSIDSASPLRRRTIATFDPCMTYFDHRLIVCTGGDLQLSKMTRTSRCNWSIRPPFACHFYTIWSVIKITIWLPNEQWVQRMKYWPLSKMCEACLWVTWLMNHWQPWMVRDEVHHFEFPGQQPLTRLALPPDSPLFSVPFTTLLCLSMQLASSAANHLLHKLQYN